MGKEPKEESFTHNFSIASKSIPVEVVGPVATFSPVVTTPDYLEKVEVACQQWLRKLGLGGTVALENKTVVVTISNHVWTKAEIEDVKVSSIC